MIQKIIKLSDYPLLSKLVTNGKTILAFNKQNYYTTLNNIKGKKIVYTNEYEANREIGQRENTIELDFDTQEHKFFKVWNGADGDKGITGDKGPKGDQGESFNSNDMHNRGLYPLPIVNNDTTDNAQAIWSAYRGKVMEDFLKSIAEIVMTDEEYQLLFNENESDTDEYGNPNEYHQIFIDMEFITENNEQTSALVHTDTKEYKTYIKYWTYEDVETISYFKNIGTDENPIYEEVIGFDLWNDLYLNPDNTETYYTRKLVITSVDPYTGEALTSEYQYTHVEVPVWLDLEFTTDIEDTTSTLLNSSEISDDGDVSKEEKEEEIIILYKPITSITVEGNKEITIPINSIITKVINIQPSDYINAYINIEYDEEYIKVFEDGRIMALNNQCPDGTTIKISAVNKNSNGEYETSNNIFDTIIVKVVIYVEDIVFDNYNIEGLSGVKYDLLPKNSTIETENTPIYYEVRPNNASNQKVEFISSNSEIVKVDYVEIDSENGYYTIELLEEGEITLYAKTTDGTNIESIVNILVITPVNDIIVNTNMDALIGYTIPISVQVSPENATHKELQWSIKETEAINEGNTITIADDNQTGLLYTVSANEFTVIVSSTDGSNYSKEIIITPKVPIYNIELNATNIIIDITNNEEQNVYQLIATINENADNKTLIWSSANETIATVDQNGLVKAISSGTTTITVKSTDGSPAIATCEVTSVTLVTDIILNNNNRYIKYNLGDNNYPPISVSIIPGTANINTLTWYTSDDSIATVDNGGKVHIIKDGKIKVYAVANDNSGIIRSIDVEIVIPTQQLLLVNEEKMRH